MTDTTFKVPEMHCGHCKAAIEDELNKLARVEYSNANLKEGTVNFGAPVRRGTLQRVHRNPASAVSLIA